MHSQRLQELGIELPEVAAPVAAAGTAAMAALHPLSDRVTRWVGMSFWEANPERSSAVLVRVPWGRASRRLALRSSRRVMSMGPTVMPRKKEMLTLSCSAMMPAER